MFYSVLVTWIVFILSILHTPPVAHGVRLKIPLTAASNHVNRIYTRQVGACSDKMEVDRSAISLDGMLLMLDQRVRFYRSSYATENINMYIETLAVPGLMGATALTVLDTLRSGGCPSYIFGGFVRDQFLGKRPNDVDAELDCDISTALDICKRSWGEGNCSDNSNSSIGHIGSPQSDPLILDLKSTSMTFYGSESLRKLEYTANSLAYDTNGSNMIIDLPGNGVADVCSSKIRIPSDRNTSASLEERGWDLWKNQAKVYRFWKLRVKGFTAFDDVTNNYIVTSTKNYIDNDAPKGLKFKNFYCGKLFDCVYSEGSNMCISSSQKLCNANGDNERRYRQILEEDLGGDYVKNTLVLPSFSELCGFNPMEGGGKTPS